MTLKEKAVVAGARQSHYAFCYAELCCCVSYNTSTDTQGTKQGGRAPLLHAGRRRPAITPAVCDITTLQTNSRGVREKGEKGRGGTEGERGWERERQAGEERRRATSVQRGQICARRISQSVSAKDTIQKVTEN